MRHWRFGITQKLTVVFVIFAAVLLIGLGVLVYANGRASLVAATHSELVSKVVDEKAALDDWVDERLSRVTALANTPSLIESLDAFTSAPAGSPEARAAYERLVRDLEPRTGPGQPFLSLFILEPQKAQVIAASDPAEEGKFRESLPYFVNGLKRPFVQNVYYSTEIGGAAMTVSAPMQAPDGRLLGVLAGRLDLNEMNEIIQRRTGLRQTDDTFLVNTSNLFVTQPRLFSDPAVLQRGVHTEAINLCLERTSGVISALDYRGVPAIISYNWLPDREVCLIVKMDEAEALAPVRAFGRTLLLIGGLVLVVASLLSAGLARVFTGPILALQETTVRFGRGELAVRATVSGNDELTALGREFNQMAEALEQKEAQLRKYATELEQRIEERTQDLRDSEERFRSTFEQAAVGIAHISPDGRFLRLNRRFCDLVDYSEEEMLALTFQDITHPDDLDADLEYVRQVLADEIKTYSMEKRYICKDGSILWIKLTVSLLREPCGEPRYFIAIVQDINELKNLEILLEQRIEERTQDLRRSNADLEQFAYVASHDLQEPLRMVSSYVQLLAQRYKGSLDSDADEFITYAVDGASRMQRLINDLLAYSRVGTRGKAFESVPCDEVLDLALDNLSVAMEESGAEVERKPLPTVMGDDTQLLQLFQNLIGNAIKFHSADKPLIQIDAEPRENEWLVSIRDNGMGIEPQYLERIFIIFQRLHGRQEYPGTGMGLAICKKIVERHGGRIWAESEPGYGSRFFFTIPSTGGTS